MVYGLTETENIVNKIVYNGQCKLAIFFLREVALDAYPQCKKELCEVQLCTPRHQ